MKTFLSAFIIFVFLFNSFLCVAEDNVQQVIQVDENSLREDKVVEFTSDNIGKKILNAVNLGLSILAIPFLLTGPHASMLSNYAVNYPLIQHSGHTISGALSNLSSSYKDSRPIEETIYYIRAKQNFALLFNKRECNWTVTEKNDEYKAFELVKREEDLNNSKEIFIFKPVSLGTTIIEAKCVVDNEVKYNIAYKIAIVD